MTDLLLNERIDEFIKLIRNNKGIMIDIFMSEKVNNILISAFIFGILFITYHFQQVKGTTYKIGFSIEETQCWKGLFSLFIVLDHLWMRHNMAPLVIFHESAVIIVSIYFLFSGYGMCISTLKNPDYVGLNFWKKKLKYLVLPMVIVDLIMLIWKCLRGLKIDKLWILRYLMGRELLNGQTWYIRELLICYFFFYLLTKTRLKTGGIIWGCFVSVTLMNVVLFTCGYGYNWYGSSYGFVLGVWLGYCVGGGAEQCTAKRLCIPLVTIISFVLTGVFSVIYKIIGKEIIWNILLTRNVMTITATIFFICIASIFTIKPGFNDKVSAASMEVYLVHILVIEICMKCGWDKQPVFLVIVVLIAVLVSGNLYHRCLKWLWNANSKSKNP